MSAHIGGIPVEEWLPFVAPVLGLFLYGHYQDRRRRARVRALADTTAGLSEPTVQRILGNWSKAGHHEVSQEHLPLLCPPGPDGASVAELAARVHSNSAAVGRLLDDLAELGYVDLDAAEGPDRRVWLTVEGHALLHATEDAILASAAADASPASEGHS